MTGKCTVIGCPYDIKAKGYCDMHLGRLYRTGNVGTAAKRKNIVIEDFDYGSPFIVDINLFEPIPEPKCNYAGCERVANGMGLCGEHRKLVDVRFKGKVRRSYFIVKHVEQESYFAGSYMLGGIHWGMTFTGGKGEAYSYPSKEEAQKEVDLFADLNYEVVESESRWGI